MPPWGVSQGGYLRGSVLHVCAVSACAQFVRSTLSVSCGAMHVDDDLFFFARGELCASVVPRRGVGTPHPAALSTTLYRKGLSAETPGEG